RPFRRKKGIEDLYQAGAFVEERLGETAAENGDTFINKQFVRRNHQIPVDRDNGFTPRFGGRGLEYRSLAIRLARIWNIFDLLVCQTNLQDAIPNRGRRNRSSENCNSVPRYR